MKKAKQVFTQAKKEDNPFDAVFCVFDRDTHRTFNEAVSMINDLKRAGKPFEAIDSTPCFECWILLHFCYARRPYSSTEKISFCGNVEKEVKKWWPEYEKGMKNLFGTLRLHTLNALERAKKANEDAVQTNRDNPSTKIPILFETLRIFFPEAMQHLVNASEDTSLPRHSR